MQARIQDFGQGGPAEFCPQGGPGVFPLKVPENYVIANKSLGQGGRASEM